jgi:hypothetical protein
VNATPSLCPRESPYSPSIISIMTLPGRGADLWVGWLSILRLVHQRSHDMSFQHIIHVTTYRWCYTPIAAISSDTYPSLIVVVRFLQLFWASGGTHTILKHHCLITSGGDVFSSQTLLIRCDIFSYTWILTISFD